MARKSWPSLTPETSKLYLVFIIIFTLLSFWNSSCCKASPPSYGNIRNISCPFTLKCDDQKCNASFFSQELSCIKNCTMLYLLPDKLLYYVESINYENLTIRIVDAGIQKNNSSSFPFHSFKEADFSLRGKRPLSKLNQPLKMIDCPSPVKSTRYMNMSSPISYSFSDSVLGTFYVYSYSFIVDGKLYVTDIEDNCRTNKVAWVSKSIWDDVFSNMSEIHDALVYGFELPWSYMYCLNCRIAHNGTGYCITKKPDHHLWYCRNINYKCYLDEVSSYHLSISCFRQIWNDFMDLCTRGKRFPKMQWLDTCPLFLLFLLLISPRNYL